MKRWLSDLSRAGLAATLGLLALAVLRWAPVFAEPPLAVRAAPLLALAVVLAVIAALTARERRLPRLRPLLVAALAFALALAGVVALRPAAGLPASAAAPWGRIGETRPGPIDIVATDLAELSGGRRWFLDWEGPLHVPASGVYRLWATGRGSLQVALDGHPVLSGSGEPLHAGADVPLSAGTHVLSVKLTRAGGPRLRLGWTRPGRDGRPGGNPDLIGPRHLGHPVTAGWWWLTDALALLVAVLAGALAWAVPWDRPRAPARGASVTRAELAWSALAHSAVIALMSWPLVTSPASLGVMDRPDGRLNAWILAWDVHALTHDPARLFEAPTFHPLPDALAFSENLLVPALLSAPGQWLSGPVLGYNLALGLSLLVSGLGVQLLVRRASGDRLAAFVAGVFFACGAHRWIRLAHLHAQVTLFLPFVLLALDRYADRRTLRRALVVGALVALQGLSSVYLGAITVVAVLAAVVVGVFGGWRARELGHLALAMALACALMAPVLFPYLRMRAFQGVEWTLADVATYATTLTSYAASGTRLYGGLTQRHLPPEEVQDTLFPGLTLLALGLAGLARAPRRYAVVFVLASALAVVVSLGPETAFYRFLHEHVVLVRGVRALSRFSLLPVLGLSVLAGFALAGRFRLALFALVLFAIESSNVPIRFAVSPPTSAAAAWLRGQEGAVADLPLGVRDTEALLEGAAHWRPLVNGDSGFVPRPYSRAMEALELPLGEEGVRLLRGLGVRHVVSRVDLPLPEAARFGEERVYVVPAGDTAAPVRAGRAVATTFSASGALVDLSAPTAISGFAFVLVEGDFVGQPGVEISLDGRAWARVAATASLADATLSLMEDPRAGLFAVHFPAVVARFVRLPPGLPMRQGAAWVVAPQEPVRVTPGAGLPQRLGQPVGPSFDPVREYSRVSRSAFLERRRSSAARSRVMSVRMPCTKTRPSASVPRSARSRSTSQLPSRWRNR